MAMGITVIIAIVFAALIALSVTAFALRKKVLGAVFAGLTAAGIAVLAFMWFTSAM